MATETLRPTSTVSNTFPSLSGSSAHAATSDDSDATYIRNNTASTTTAIFEITNTGLSSETVDSVDVRARARSESSANSRFRLGLELGGNTEYAAYHNTVPTSATNYTDTSISRPGGGSWAVSDLDSLRVVVQGDEVASDGIRIFELYVDINYSAGGTTGQIKAKIGGSFTAKPVKVRLSGSFVTKPLKYKEGGVFNETTY